MKQSVTHETKVTSGNWAPVVSLSQIYATENPYQKGQAAIGTKTRNLRGDAEGQVVKMIVDMNRKTLSWQINEESATKTGTLKLPVSRNDAHHCCTTPPPRRRITAPPPPMCAGLPTILYWVTKTREIATQRNGRSLRRAAI